MTKQKNMYDLHEKPFNLMTDEEKNEWCLKYTGEPYREATEEEKEAIKREYGIKE